MRILVLLSGGIDSAVVLAGCVASKVDCYAIGFDYDQPHLIELDHAEDIAEHYEVPFERIRLPALFPKVDDVVFAGRNLVMAAVAVAIAQERGFDRVAVGCNASDWERFPDCRPPFWKALDECASAYGVKVVAPLIHNDKRDVIKAAAELNVPLGLTWSCYSPTEGGLECGECLACKTRRDALCAS